MTGRFVLSIVTGAALAAFVALVLAPAAGQERQGGASATPAGPMARAADGQPDFTAVYDVNGVEDIRDTLAPGSEIVLTPYGQQRIKANSLDKDPNARCLPWGPTRMMCCTRMPIAFVNHKDLIVILTESQQTFRLVYMDGRPLPDDLYDSQGEVDPQVGGWMGFSRGEWDGDTLVVETVGADDRTWIDGHGGHEHSSKMKLTERFQPVDANTVQYTATIDDPVFYQQPWSFVKTFRRLPDRIMSHSCVENERDLKYMLPVPVEGAEPRPVRRQGSGD